MNIRRKNRFAAEVSTSSLNDIMFFLLLFFLIISTVANPNVIKLFLPKATASQKINKKQISLSVTADKRIFIDKVEIPTAELENALANAIVGIDEPTIVLRIEKSLSVQDLVDVLQITTKLKIKVVMATEKG